MNSIIIVLTSVLVLLLVLWWKRRGHVVPIVPPTQTPLSFNGGYVTYPAGVNYDTTRAEFSCKFKTKTSETVGVITAATAEDADHFIVRLVDGKVVAEVGTGINSSAKLKDPKAVNDNLWHKVTFTRNGLNNILTVDDTATPITKALGDNLDVHLTKPSVITLGGAVKDDLFKGCIKDVVFNGRLIPDSELVIEGLVTRGCTS